MHTDTDILQAVVDAQAAADERGDNWADHLPDYCACDDRYASDPWYIGSLPDGRTVWLTREDLTGPDRYSIADDVADGDDDSMEVD